MSIKDITIIITSFKSENKLRTCLSSIDSNCRVLNIENSNNHEHKTKLRKNLKMCNAFCQVEIMVMEKEIISDLKK